MEESPRLLKFVMLVMTVAIGMVVSPILRIEGTCPMARLINIVCAVFLGPGYTFACAFTIGILRMTLMGILPLALTSAIFEAALSGILYRLPDSKSVLTVVGEIVGTSTIGTLVSYPVMTLLADKQGIGQAFCIPLFLGRTLIGGSIAFVFLDMLAKTEMLTSIQKQLGAKVYDESHKSNIHNIWAAADSAPYAA